MSDEKSLLGVLSGRPAWPPPIWLMRQAGRYLPEYRALREQAGGFLDLCFDPHKAAEVTLQPIRRFGFDAAILFSDILVVPLALGQRVWFEAGEGPHLEPLTREGARRIGTIDHDRLAPVYRAITMIREQLPPSVTFLGFCGAPWTLATYMVAGRGGDDQAAARLFAYEDPEGFAALIEILVAASVAYLVRQLQAGVDAVQIFDTWAGVLGPRERQTWCVEPMQRIVEGVRTQVPGAKVIAFPRGIGTGLGSYVRAVQPDAIGLDWMVDKDVARDAVPQTVAIQGNLDPMVLLAGGAALDRAIDDILAGFAGRRMIFNLGHGILPATPIAHVERLVARVREAR